MPIERCPYFRNGFPVGKDRYNLGQEMNEVALHLTQKKASLLCLSIETVIINLQFKKTANSRLTMKL